MRIPARTLEAGLVGKAQRAGVRHLQRTTLASESREPAARDV
jgi:hypothetical protein